MKMYILYVLLLCFFVSTVAGDKRLVDEVDALDKLNQLSGQVESLQSTVNSLQTSLQQIQNGGLASTFVRWGRTVCPTGNELAYKGYMGGSHYTHSGGAANWLCLTDEPQWGYYETGVSSGAKVYGGEYEFSDFHYNGGSKYFGKNLNDEDAPCAVCRSPRPTVVMIPGRKECYTGWTKEYSGYLVAGDYQHASATEFVCLDTDAEMEAGGAANNDGKVIYLTEAYCGSLKCPPYIQGRELTCVVCSK